MVRLSGQPKFYYVSMSVEMSTNRALPRDAHYCHPSQGKWGAGDDEPFLGQELWAAE